jgi:hypothetical protein
MEGDPGDVTEIVEAYVELRRLLGPRWNSRVLQERGYRDM